MEIDTAEYPPAVQWSLSLLDFHAHAVDVWNRDHPAGVLVALCGQLLLMGDLQEFPQGGLCIGCSMAVVARRRSGLVPTSGVGPGGCPVRPAPVRWARAPGDVRYHGVAPEQLDQIPEHGRAAALCGQLLPSDDLITQDTPTSPLCFACVVGVPPPVLHRGLSGTS